MTGKTTGWCMNEREDVRVDGESWTCWWDDERTMDTPCRECVYFRSDKEEQR